MKRKLSVEEAVNLYFPTPPKHEVEEAGRRIWKRIAEELEKHDTSLRSLYGDGWSAPALKPRELQVLSAVASPAAQASRGTVAEIREIVEARGGRMGAISVWMTLQRLKWRELLTEDLRVTEDGERALARAREEAKMAAEVAEETARC